MGKGDTVWQAKLLARIHDPAEKALVLLRDPGGHETGTVSELRQRLFPEGVPPKLEEIVKRADQWAAAADRPQFPRADGQGQYYPSCQVNFAKEPVLIHPLSGDDLDLRSLQEIPVEPLKALSLDHFDKLVFRHENGEIDCRKTALSLWRFGPETPAKDLGALWGLLPADTRVPDHTIWAHLDLSSAFAGAFTADPEAIPSLFIVSIGPVQGFIAQARTTSDLWAGSHLLSMISWEAIKIVCERFGPDAVIFPQLRNVPVVDLWLHREMGIPMDFFKNPRWERMRSDANPIFSAALPNKFVAVVPASAVEAVVQETQDRLQKWVKDAAEEAVRMIVDEIQEDVPENSPLRDQVNKQLSGFPEVHWAAAPWSLIQSSASDSEYLVEELIKAMQPFYPEAMNTPGLRLWALLSAHSGRESSAFFKPNPGALYPAIYDLTDRLMAAAKSVRPFSQLEQEGFRCSLCGEREWLTLDRNELLSSPGDRGMTLWRRIRDKKPAWARRGEHLCALCTLKRIWPSLFSMRVREMLGVHIGRYVVSTHTMALATNLDRWLALLRTSGMSEKQNKAFMELSSAMQNDYERAAMPASLRRRIEGLTGDKKVEQDFAYGLPTFLDELREEAREADEEGRKGESQYRKVEKKLEQVLGNKPEAYYGLILMDGDRMGAWITGTDLRLGLTNEEVWHPSIKGYARSLEKDAEIAGYLKHPRPPSPARHAAMSAALNAFSLDLSRQIVEEVFKGKLLYSGGDDLLAMISVDDLLPAMLLLRMVYSGIGIHNGNEGLALGDWLGAEGLDRIVAHKGYVKVGKRLLRVMGQKASVSFGAVVAHHTAPLSGVIRELRVAEKRAKNEGRRDAFSITLMKRAGAKTHLTLPWLLGDGNAEVLRRSPMGVLVSVRNAFADESMSRRAAYFIQDWVRKLPSPELVGGDEGFKKMLAVNIRYQFERQCSDATKKKPYGVLGPQLAELTLRVRGRTGKKDEKELVHDMLTVAEFLAREGRIEARKLETKEKGND